MESNIDSSQYVSHLANEHDAPRKKSKEGTKLRTSSKIDLNKDSNVKKTNESPKTKKVKTPKEKTSSRVEKVSPKTAANKEQLKKKSESKRKGPEKDEVSNEYLKVNESKTKINSEADDKNPDRETSEINLAYVTGTSEELGTREVDSGISITDGPSSANLTRENERESIQSTEEQPKNTTTLIRPKSARPKSGERGLPKSTVKDKQEELIKPLEMTSKRFLFERYVKNY